MGVLNPTGTDPMQPEKQITYHERKEIDVSKWNRCIKDAGNGRIYGYSFYLDAMADQWDGLVLNDYEAVMPLPWRKKWRIYYLYQPFLTAQLGLFGNHISAGDLEFFLAAIPQKFRYWDFPLNQQNLLPVEAFPLYQRMNYVLPLHRPYQELYKAYRENIRRNIRKSLGYGSVVKNEIPIDRIIALTKLQAREASEKDFANFANLYHQLHQQGNAKTYGIVGKNGDLLASAAFLFSHQRAYYILVGNHPNGRTLGASHALVDAFIQDHAGTDLILDFEGSDIRNLAFFYTSFGAREERYAAIRLNRLPWWARWKKWVWRLGLGVVLEV